MFKVFSPACTGQNIFHPYRLSSRKYRVRLSANWISLPPAGSIRISARQ